MSAQRFRVGLLAYGAIGDEHARAVESSAGLIVAAVCDMNPARIEAALEICPDAIPFSDADAMLESGEVDVVIVSTPPNSHYSWAKKALALGLHVVLEKPMALTTDECDELMQLASDAARVLVVYQNRRFDQDFLTIKALIDSGEIGDVFAYESFVGGYSKPCSFWHSDALISGGAIFDWGSHFIDQILSILPGQIDFVTGLNQKRVWDHITNADHAQVIINFKDGVQASFINSDLSAARKPKFYILGTKGAIVGDWDTSGDGAVADLPAIISVYDNQGEAYIAEYVEAPPYAFHTSLSDCLTEQIPMSVQAQQSRDVVAIMAAAESSALNNGLPVTPVLLRT